MSILFNFNCRNIDWYKKISYFVTISVMKYRRLALFVKVMLIYLRSIAEQVIKTY